MHGMCWVNFFLDGISDLARKVFFFYGTCGKSLCWLSFLIHDKMNRCLLLLKVHLSATQNLLWVSSGSWPVLLETPSAVSKCHEHGFQLTFCGTAWRLLPGTKATRSSFRFFSPSMAHLRNWSFAYGLVFRKGFHYQTWFESQ